MKIVTWGKAFDKDLKRVAKRGKDGEKLNEVIELLEREDEIPSRYNDHALSGNWKGFRDLHIEPDWLLIYQVTKDEVILTRTGTHSDLF